MCDKSCCTSQNTGWQRDGHQHSKQHKVANPIWCHQPSFLLHLSLTWQGMEEPHSSWMTCLAPSSPIWRLVRSWHSTLTKAAFRLSKSLVNGTTNSHSDENTTCNIRRQAVIKTCTCVHCCHDVRVPAATFSKSCLGCSLLATEFCREPKWYYVWLKPAQSASLPTLH